jgi:hypothetical protein
MGLQRCHLARSRPGLPNATAEPELALLYRGSNTRSTLMVQASRTSKPT